MKVAVQALAVTVALATPAHAQDFINILTGGTSGVYYPLGVALSQIYADGIPGAQPSVQSTRASVENLNLIQEERGEIAFSLGDAVSLAAAGNAEAGFEQPLDKLRIVAPIYSNYIQVVATADSGIQTIEGLSGRSMSVGAPASGTELNARAVLGAAGIAYDDLGQVEYLPFGESVELMKNRQLDATLQSAGLGVASIRDLSTTTAITIVPIPAELVAAIGDPAYVPAVIPAGTYEGQTADVPTAAIRNYLVTNSEEDEELVYQMTRLLFENLDDMVAAHAAAADISLEGLDLANLPVPLHPGAERYFREAGVLQ